MEKINSILSKGYKFPSGKVNMVPGSALQRKEAERHDLILTTAQERHKELKAEPEDFHKVTMPEELYNILSSYDHNAGIIAGIAFLQKNGFTIL